ncbi:MAG: carboxypeptidase-like regulatory domain-containing protein [Saprospiraceae bacterium]
MNTFKKFGLLFFLATLLFSSCRKDDESSGTFPPQPSTPERVVNGTFYGTVMDEANQPIEDALVTLGLDTRTTDENGIFAFKNVAINQKGSLVKVEKEGYFHNSKFVGSNLNKRNFVNIKMIRKILTGSFSTTNGGTITTNDGASIEFAANAIRTESGAAYNGNVNVYATWLDPTAPDLAQRMPGDLRATNADNQQQQLTTFGMIGVELEGDAGEALNLAAGQTATIALPVPTSLLSNAPATIPLWHFEETTGYWIEEGEATLQGNKYVGTVSHFSFWNCDLPGDFIYIDGVITNPEGEPLASVLVRITETSSGVSNVGWTDESGAFAGAVPSNQALTLAILNTCGEVIFSESIGPFTADATIPTISITGVEEEFINFSGVLIDCDNNPVENGYLKVSFNNQTTIIPADENGGFNGTVSTCNASTIDVIGYDLTNLKESGVTSIVVDTPSIDLANVFVCEDLTEFVTFSIAGVEVTDPNPKTTLELNGIPDLLLIRAQNPDQSVILPLMILTVKATAQGTYTPEYVSFDYYDPITGQNFSVDCEEDGCDGIINIEFTTFEAVGGFAIGSFSGTLEPVTLQLGDPQAVSGSFRVLLE